MKATQLFRDQLGLTQEVMAQYLGITRSLLAMYEAGKRELPTTALAKLADITLFFEQKKTTAKETSKHLKQQELEVKKLLKHHAKELEYNQIKEQRLLEALEKKHSQSLELNSLALHLQSNKDLQADVLLHQARIGIIKYGLASQTKQVLKLESIKSQLNHINILKKM